MFSALGRSVLLQRAQDYTRRHKPQLIGVVGAWGAALAKQALATVLRDYTDARIAFDGATSRADVALGIIGQEKQGYSWLLPLWLSGAREAAHPEPKTVISELPVRRPGQVDEVARMIPYSVALALNAHESRLAYFGTQELVAHEVMALPLSLSDSGVAVINMDDPLLATYSEKVSCRSVQYGYHPKADVRIQRLDPMPDGGFSVQLLVANKIIEGVFSQAATRLVAHTLVGALAAAYAATDNVGIIEHGLKVLKTWKVPSGYGDVQEKSGITVISDTFDATAKSIELELHAMDRFLGRKLAVLGDVPDLGARSVIWHKEIGKLAAEQVDVFVGVGTAMREAQVAAMKSGYEIDTHHFESSRDVGKWLPDYIHSGDTVFIAGSHEMKMGEVVRRI